MQEFHALEILPGKDCKLELPPMHGFHLSVVSIPHGGKGRSTLYATVDGKSFAIATLDASQNMFQVTTDLIFSETQKVVFRVKGNTTLHCCGYKQELDVDFEDADFDEEELNGEAGAGGRDPTQAPAAENEESDDSDDDEMDDMEDEEMDDDEEDDEDEEMNGDAEGDDEDDEESDEDEEMNGDAEGDDEEDDEEEDEEDKVEEPPAKQAKLGSSPQSPKQQQKVQSPQGRPSQQQNQQKMQSPQGRPSQQQNQKKMQSPQGRPSQQQNQQKMQSPQGRPSQQKRGRE